LKLQLLVEDKFECSVVISAEVLWPCQFIHTAFKTGMEHATELALTKCTTKEDVGDGGRRSSVELTGSKSSFLTCETEITLQAQASSSSSLSDYVSHLFICLLSMSVSVSCFKKVFLFWLSVLHV